MELIVIALWKPPLELKLANILYRFGDQGILEYCGPQGLYNFLIRFPVLKQFNNSIHYN